MTVCAVALAIYIPFRNADETRAREKRSLKLLNTPAFAGQSNRQGHILEVEIFYDAGYKENNLRHLQQLPELFSVTLTESIVTEVGLEQVASLKGLKGLHLRECNISVGAFASIAAMKNLKWLHLVETKIAASDLPLLESMQSLEQLWIIGTGLTPADEERLQKALPATQIRGNSIDGEMAGQETATGPDLD